METPRVRVRPRIKYGQALWPYPGYLLLLNLLEKPAPGRR